MLTIPWSTSKIRTAAERAALTQLVARERVSGLKRMRASMLLKADDGMADAEIPDDIDVALATVERVRKRRIERGIEACLERKPQDNRMLEPSAEARR